ncbi:E3 ubiquitin-protein ligase UHRF1-like [Diorhabda sublineata]|uniref:E3 ubiquitin-protein ligase UHRF1-like n=1 Tax=Diorhabda sublineata TaxID=1163346 RepID=UPI0024E07E5C|nr:E3 ubiquitin-protein ligase UHRF1-like [Diorhabda sublineata]
MYIKVRKDGDANQEWIVEISKKDSVLTIHNKLEKLTGFKTEEQTLLFKGKTLEFNVPILDYQIENNNVVQMFIKSPKRNESKPVEISYNNIDEDFIDIESQYYKVGDFIDVMIQDDGSWYEAHLTKIFIRNEGSSSSINNVVDEKDLTFRVKSASHIVPGFETDANFKDIRPRSYYIYKLNELSPEMIVLANYNMEEKKSRGLWYNFKIDKVSRTNVIGTVLLGGDKAPLENCTLHFINEIMRIEEPVLLSQITKKEKTSPHTEKTKRKYPYRCVSCKDNEKMKCRNCGCKICHGKENWESIILCDECDDEYHIYCLKPPLTEVPSEDWYCPSCKVDDSKIVKRGEKVKLSKKRANMASKTTTCTRDWGRGMACAGRTKQCTVVPKDHFGPIPGVDVGTRWRFRIQVSEAGVHRPHVSGIHGSGNKGATSIVLSGGYADDLDNGNEFIYSGSGGRDLSGNKRINIQTSDQELTRANKALALNCNAPFNEKGAEAKDWRKGLPLRVVRSYKGKELSKYCPDEGLRYDGIYKVVKYYPDKNESGLIVYKYVIRRDDPNPAPWETGGQELDVIYPEGYLEAQALKEKGKELKTGKGVKRKTNTTVLTDLSNVKKKSKKSYELPDEIEELIKNDVQNAKLWLECKEEQKNGKPDYLAKVEEVFKCICCQEIVYEPITTECKHNFCQECLKRAFKLELYTCPCCRFDLGKDYKLIVNLNLSKALKLLFPGYGSR